MGMNDWTRRDFLKRTGAAALGALAAGYPQRFAGAEDIESIVPTADTMIVLWMAGGMAHTETFDPKKYTAYESGLPSDAVLSTFSPIDTVVDHIKISEGLPEIASVMDRMSLIRTFQAGDLGHILHSRHQYHWHTGYVPPLTVAAPHIGSFIARTLGRNNPTCPHSSTSVSASTWVKARKLKPHDGGIPGQRVRTVQRTRPIRRRGTVQPPAGMTQSRFEIVTARTGN